MTKARWKKTSVRINPEVWLAAKDAARRAPMTLGELVEEAILQYIGGKDDGKPD